MQAKPVSSDAYYYYRLITRFGDVILTTRTMDIDS